MHYTVEIHHDQRILCVRVSGTIAWANALGLSREMRETARKYEYGILCDVREAALHAGIDELYRYPRETEFLKDPALKSIRVALLTSHGKDEHSWEFYEETAKGAGVRVRVFLEDEQAALAWASGIAPDHYERPLSW